MHHNPSSISTESPYFHKEMAIFLVTVIMPFTFYSLSAWQMTEAENMFVDLYGRKNWVCGSDGWEKGQKEEGRPRKGQRRSPRKLWLTSILPTFWNHIKYHLELQRKNKSKHQVLPRLRINKHHTSSLAGKALNKCLPNFLCGWRLISCSRITIALSYCWKYHPPGGTHTPGQQA